MKIITGQFTVSTSNATYVNLGATPKAVLIMPLYEPVVNDSNIYPRRVLLIQGQAYPRIAYGSSITDFIGYIRNDGFTLPYSNTFTSGLGGTSKQYIAFMEDD